MAKEEEKYHPDPNEQIYKITLYSHCHGDVIGEFSPVFNVGSGHGWANWKDWNTGKRFEWRNGPILIEELD